MHDVSPHLCWRHVCCIVAMTCTRSGPDASPRRCSALLSQQCSIRGPAAVLRMVHHLPAYPVFVKHTVCLSCATAALQLAQSGHNAVVQGDLEVTFSSSSTTLCGMHACVLFTIFVLLVLLFLFCSTTSSMQ